MYPSEIIARIDYEVVLGELTDDQVLDVIDALASHFTWALQIMVNDGRDELVQFVTDTHVINEGQGMLA
jgi:hypothetical protein